VSYRLLNSFKLVTKKSADVHEIGKARMVEYKHDSSKKFTQKFEQEK
jgi:hypothetical protein